MRHSFLNELYFGFFFESSKVWKKPKYNSLRNKCLIFDIYIYIYIYLKIFASVYYYQQNNEMSYILVFFQFLDLYFNSGFRTPLLSKVEFIVTGAVIPMFPAKLVFLLSLINITHLLKIFWKHLKSNCEEELCFSLGFLIFRYSQAPDASCQI